MRDLLELPIYAWARARSAQFTLQYIVLNSLATLLPGPGGRKYAPPRRDIDRLLRLHRGLTRLLREDSHEIASGRTPLSVLKPESPAHMMTRIPLVLLDSWRVHSRRMRGRTTEFDTPARSRLDELPRYYRRNFHFQTDGYLSEESAEVYEHQVEMLFSGTADAMRRLILRPLRERFGTGDGKGLRFLELGAGTGRATRFVKAAFPEAQVTAIDLSDPYLKHARRRLAEVGGVDFVRANAEDLPFKAEEFDAVYSVFLFHELPRSVRLDIIRESLRVTRPGGLIALVDSIQTGDWKDADPVLPDFPRQFHEPFYRDYIAHPMEDVLEQAGLSGVQTHAGFLSKACWATRREGRAGARKAPASAPASDPAKKKPRKKKS